MHFFDVVQEALNLKHCFFALLCVTVSLSSSSTMCGDEPCNLYSPENILQDASRTAPPDQGWSVQGEGMAPPGSLNVNSKREIYGGNMYGAFGSEGTEQRLHTEETIAFAYRELPSETGRVFSLPNGVGPPSDGHFLMFNFDSTPPHIERKIFHRDSDLMFSSSGLSVLDQSAQKTSDSLQVSVRGRKSVRAGINPVTGIDLSDGDDSAPGFIGNCLQDTNSDLG
mmetsp:Transcript_16361/g.34661  ORF Transcript_16361/g.34661 Transcript_16361/m.34661 type:complete len:225 (-) Transcript_16361:235-909(-)